MSQPHVVLEKLDGHMATVMVVQGQVVSTTKKGITKHAGMAWRCDRRHLAMLGLAHIEMDQVVSLAERGFRPAFECCSKACNVRVTHTEDKLVLLACRHIECGFYTAPHGHMVEMAGQRCMGGASGW